MLFLGPFAGARVDLLIAKALAGDTTAIELLRRFSSQLELNSDRHDNERAKLLRFVAEALLETEPSVNAIAVLLEEAWSLKSFGDRRFDVLTEQERAIAETLLYFEPLKRRQINTLIGGIDV